MSLLDSPRVDPPPSDPPVVVGEVSSWLTMPADEVDARVDPAVRAGVLAAVQKMNHDASEGDAAALHGQQLLLARLYGLVTRIPPAQNAEGSVVVHEVMRLLENATIADQDRWIDPALLDRAPTEPRAYLSWLKQLARSHRVFKHPYYTEFIRDHATVDDIRNYVIQESVVDGRFDDLLAMMQVGTNGATKMEISANFWDEMGNGNPADVHTHLFNKIYDVFDITDAQLEEALTANALLSGNIAVLLCRYRRLFAEAVGFMGMVEWLVPDRFKQVIHAWERLGLPDEGIVYHRLHTTIDSQHARGWFHNVVVPSAGSEAMRRGMARGVLWRLDSSARYLDERLTEVAHRMP